MWFFRWLFIGCFLCACLGALQAWAMAETIEKDAKIHFLGMTAKRPRERWVWCSPAEVWVRSPTSSINCRRPTTSGCANSGWPERASQWLQVVLGLKRVCETTVAPLASVIQQFS